MSAKQKLKIINILKLLQINNLLDHNGSLERAKQYTKRIYRKFHPQPELHPKGGQDLGDGDGGHVEGPGGCVEGAIDPILFLQSSFHTCLHIFRKWRHQILTTNTIHILRLLSAAMLIWPTPQNGVRFFRLPVRVAHEPVDESRYHLIPFIKI